MPSNTRIAPRRALVDLWAVPGTGQESPGAPWSTSSRISTGWTTRWSAAPAERVSGWRWWKNSPWPWGGGSGWKTTTARAAPSVSVCRW